MKTIVIMSLGDVVTPDINKTVQQFIQLITNKKEDGQKDEIARIISGVLQSCMPIIENFKLGNLTEEHFRLSIRIALDNATGVRITDEEFNQAWHAMNPPLEAFKEVLDSVIVTHAEHNKHIILISYTNPLDMRHLKEELERGGYTYGFEGNTLTEIAGIKLNTSYVAGQKKAELFRAVAEPILFAPVRPQSALLANRFRAVSSTMSDTAKPLGPRRDKDVVYVHCVNNVANPVLHAGLSKDIEDVGNVARELNVRMIIWNKAEELTLSDVCSDAVASCSKTP